MIAAVSPLVAPPGSAGRAYCVDILNEIFAYDAHTRYGYSGSSVIPFTWKQS